MMKNDRPLTPSAFGVALLGLVSIAIWPGSAVAEDHAPEGVFAAAIATAQKRTVKIYGAAIGRTPGYATGLIVSADGEILTIDGALLAGESLRVQLPDGTGSEARVLRRSESLQAVLIKVERKTPDYFGLNDAPAARQGDWIVALSNAFKVAEGSEPLSASLGILSLRTRLDAHRGYHDFPYSGDVYLIDAITSNPGAAGGAIVDVRGALLGMIGKVIEGNATNTRLNYAIPSDVLHAFVSGSDLPLPNAIVKTAATGELGIRLFALGGRKAPAYVDRILPGSAAAAAGLRSDDLIVSMAGQVVRDSGDFRRIAATLSAGSEVAIEVKRKDQLLPFRLVPKEAK